MGYVWLVFLFIGLLNFHDPLLSERQMSALAFGLVAALCWGFHDVCARFLSQRTAISSCMFTVLLIGLIFHSLITLTTSTIEPIPKSAVYLSIGSGIFFGIATFGLYYAFQRGPVRLVSPLIAGYPIISVGWAVFLGDPVSEFQWLAVIIIVAGVSIVAVLSDSSDDDIPPIGLTIVFSIIAAIGFAGTFALGQSASALSDDMPNTLVTRLTAFLFLATILILLKQPIWPNRQSLPWLIAMGLADGIALMCVLSAGDLPDAKYASVASSLFGMLTIILAWIFLRERMTKLQWAGCAVAFLGVGYLAV